MSVYTRKGAKIDRGNHKEAIQFLVGEYAQIEAGAFMRIMDGQRVMRTMTYGYVVNPNRLSNGLYYARLGRFVEGGGIVNVVNIYGTEAEVRHDAEAFIRGYKTASTNDTDTAKIAPDTDNVKGMQRKIAAQAKEIARLKRANEDICKAANDFQAARREEQKRHASEVDQIRAQMQPAKVQPRPLAPDPTIHARFVSLEARVAKLEAAAAGPIVIDGAEADQMGLIGLKRHANLTGRPVHVLGPSRCHTGRIVEPRK